MSGVKRLWSAVEANGDTAWATFDGASAWYEFGYDGALNGATATLYFRNSSTDETKSIPDVTALSSSNASSPVYIIQGQQYKVTVAGGTSPAFTLTLHKMNDNGTGGY